MNLFELYQHPSFVFLGRRIPGPFIPIALVGLPLMVRSQTLKYYIYSSSVKKGIEHLLVLLHLLLYTGTIRQMLQPEGYQRDDITLALLEYVSLVIGEAILDASRFWSYTLLAGGWIFTLPKAPGSHTLSPIRRTWLLLILSSIGALQTGDRLSKSAQLSAWLLLTKATFQIWSNLITSPRSLAVNLAGLSLPLATRIFILVFQMIGHNAPWFKRHTLKFQARLRYIWVNCGGEFQMARYRRCAEFPVARFTLLGAGWIISSFLFTCLWWCWLFAGEPSEGAVWIAVSCIAAFFSFVPILVLIQYLQLMQDRPRAVSLEEFLQRQITDCFAALWWNTCIYLLLWVILEIMRVV
jgi:hypothetical protein